MLNTNVVKNNINSSYIVIIRINVKLTKNDNNFSSYLTICKIYSDAYIVIKWKTTLEGINNTDKRNKSLQE